MDLLQQRERNEEENTIKEEWGENKSRVGIMGLAQDLVSPEMGCQMSPPHTCQPLLSQFLDWKRKTGTEREGKYRGGER